MKKEGDAHWLVVMAIIVGIFIMFQNGAFGQDNNIPAPFCKAKEMAQKQIPVTGNRHLLTFEEKDCTFVVGYIPNLGFIGVGLTAPRAVVIEFNERTAEFSVLVGNMRIPVDKDKALEGAFSIFRELVKRGLI